MLKNLVNVLNQYADDYIKGAEELQKAIDQIRATYKDEYAEKSESAVFETYNSDLTELRTKAKEELTTIFDNVKTELKENVAQPLPDNFWKEYEILKTVTLTAGEFKLLIDKYVDNYMACKLVVDIGKKNGHILKLNPLEERLSDLDKLKEKCFAFIEGYKGKNATYEHEILLRGNIISSVEEDIKSNIVIPETE